jgi:hypothetical protein
MMNKILKGKIVECFGSQFEFARTIGEHESVVSRVIRGHCELDQVRREKWAKVLETDVKRLFPHQEINDV